MPRQHTVKSSLHSWQPTITNKQQGEQHRQQDTKERIHGDCHSVSTGIIVHAVHYAIHKPTSLISYSCASSKEELQIATKYKRANREKTTLEWKLAFSQGGLGPIELFQLTYFFQLPRQRLGHLGHTKVSTIPLWTTLHLLLTIMP